MIPATSPSPDRATRVGVVALTVVVFAVVVGFVTLRLREGLKAEILGGEATKLMQVASMQLANEAEVIGEAAPGALLAAVLRAAKLGGVIGVRVFDAKRDFGGALPWEWSEERPGDADWRELQAGRSVARMHRRESNADLVGLIHSPAKQQSVVPLLEVWVPLRASDQGPVSGGAQFWMDGEELAAKLAALDRRLVSQAVLAWLAGSLIIVAPLLWVFNRLAAANRELRVRGENLQRANRELVLAAKTSALGSVTAHLIHALKNPLAGLELFVASQAEPAARTGNGDEELAAATELTRRLRTMVNDVVGVLRDEHTGTHFELSGNDMVELALAKARPLARARGVEVAAELSCPTMLPSRRANLATLALYNLLQNAVEASPAGGRVRLAAMHNSNGAIDVEVRDEAGGLPEAVRARLFEPCVSSKIGGSGLGLALSQQIARHAGGRIELVRSDAGGTTFRLVLEPEA